MNALTPTTAASGPKLTFDYDQDAIDCDPASGEILLPAAILADGLEFVLTAHDAEGIATGAYLLTLRALGLPPQAVGSLEDLLLDQGAVPASVASAPAFRGDALTFELERAPGGVTIDADTGVVTIATATPLAAAEIRVRASNAAGSAIVSFTVTVRSSATVFDRDASLAEMSFLSTQAPAWFQVADGYARLIPATAARAHGVWSKARGDGLYRTLVRWSGATLAPSLDRRFSFGARVRKLGNDWSGIRVETFATSTGDRRLHIREYTGTSGVTRSLDTVTVGWAYDTWYWVEVEVLGTSIKGRLYPEGGTAPAWQVAAATTQTTDGGFGPGGFPALDQSPVIDVRRIEFLPLTA